MNENQKRSIELEKAKRDHQYRSGFRNCFYERLACFNCKSIQMKPSRKKPVVCICKKFPLLPIFKDNVKHKTCDAHKELINI